MLQIKLKKIQLTTKILKLLLNKIARMDWGIILHKYHIRFRNCGKCFGKSGSNNRPGNAFSI